MLEFYRSAAARRAVEPVDVDDLDGVFDRIPDPTLVLDERGAITRCNASARRLFGGAQDARLTGQPLRSLLLRGDRAILDEHVRSGPPDPLRFDARAAEVVRP